MTVQYGAVSVDWLGYATVRLEGETGAVVYVDPGRYGVLDDYDARDGDLVLVSHDDHYDPEGIRRVAGEDAIVVVHESIDADEIDRVDEQPEDLPYEVERVRADESFVLGPLDLFTTPAYNEPDGPYTDEDGTPYHLEGEGCGFGVTIDGVTAFWPGDTDAFPFHEDLAVDVFLPPIGGAFTMDRRDAAALAEATDPGLVLPIHYDTFEALETDAEAFVVDVATRGVPVVLDDN
ncbi:MULTISPECIES: MBL fold metallo-hydrolase [Natrialbaceae]|uniref:MBL fold metallo-hydrolase n=1 Tax=Natrialbaceae TaxID=1644061 RepID=UPI00207C1423|nr:MBL fold metallo-hydrolase [Natronococcus sp. CG52]